MFTLGRHALSAYVSVLGHVGATLASAALLVRAVGADAFGTYAIVMSAAALVVSLEPTINAGVIRAFRRGGSPDAAFVLASRRLQLLLSAATAGVGIAAGIWAAFAGGSVGLFVLVASTAFGAATVLASAVANARLIAEERYGTISSSVVLGGALQVGLIWVLRDRIGVAAGGVSFLAGTLLTRAVQLRQAPRLAILAEEVRRLPLRHVINFAWPIVILGLSPHLVNLVDLVVLGTITGTATAGLYRLGSVLPMQALNSFFRGYDVIYPRLAGPEAPLHEHMILRLNRLAVPIAGFGLGLLAAASEIFAVVMAGTRSPITATAVAGFAIVAALNVPAHGLSLLAIARNHHRDLARIVIGETLVNAVLTLLLVSRYGFVGAIAASIAAIALSNVVLVPLVVQRHFSTLPVLRYMGESLVLGSTAWVTGFAVAKGLMWRFSV